jgi:hypothetical protein
VELDDDVQRGDIVTGSDGNKYQPATSTTTRWTLTNEESDNPSDERIDVRHSAHLAALDADVLHGRPRPEVHEGLPGG